MKFKGDLSNSQFRSRQRPNAILRPEDYERWMFDDCDEALKAVGLYRAQMMSAVQLGPAINSSRNESPDLLIPCA